MPQYDFFLQSRRSSVGDIINAAVVRHLRAVMRRFASFPAKILEIGPGRGELAQSLISAGNEYTCCDNNQAIIDRLKTLGARTRLCTVPPIPEESKSFDIVVASHVFEHFIDHRAAFGFLEESYRVLKDGGIIILFNPNYLGWGADFFDIDYTHSFPVTPSRLGLMFEDAGFHLEIMRNLYGNLPFFPGWCIDKTISLGCALLALFFPMRRKILKAKIAFHPNLLAIGRKPASGQSMEKSLSK